MVSPPPSPPPRGESARGSAAAAIFPPLQTHRDGRSRQPRSRSRRSPLPPGSLQPRRARPFPRRPPRPQRLVAAGPGRSSRAGGRGGPARRAPLRRPSLLSRPPLPPPPAIPSRCAESAARAAAVGPDRGGEEEEEEAARAAGRPESARPLRAPAGRRSPMERVSEAAACGPSSGCYTYQVSRHSADMLHSLNQQRKNGGRFCDVLLRVGDESFPAHRAVLAACSEYFESVFSAQLGDGAGGGGGGGAEGGATEAAAAGGAAAAAGGAPGGGRELEMHTISSKVFGDILDFAYTSRIVVRLESFPELMTAAKFLLMRSVIDICQEVIKQSNVQILVPPARPDIMLFRPGAADLGFPLDMTNGATLAPNGNGIAGMPEDEATRAALTAAQSSLPVLQGVDRLPMVAGPLSPPLLASPFQNVAASAPTLSTKRGRGRPRKANLLDSMMFGTPGGLREAGILPCGLCGKVFTDANRLRQHEAQHGVTSLQLGYIDIPPPRLGENGVPGQDDPDAPRKRSRTRKQVACEICGKIFRDVYHLNRHKLSHSGEKPYSCPVCGLRFKRKDRMSYHVRSHDGSVGKPYICQSCGKGFSR